MIRHKINTALAFVIAVSLFAFSAPAVAYCPCYTLSSAYNNLNCGVEAIAGTNPTVAQWQTIFTTVAAGPSAWGQSGPPVADIGQGCGKPEATHPVPAKFPCELLRAMAMQESGWRQFCNPDTPADQKPTPERTIISFDCGYGVGQVTSGMHIGENPSFNRMRVAGEPLYNMATGASILAGKWRATNCVGDNQPKVIEHWYTAVWAYNGLSYKNNPNNPNYDANRGVYNPKVGGGYTYQERVFGWVENPPTTAHWSPIALAYPNRADVGNSGSTGGISQPPDLPEPNCASPTNCTNKRSTHVTACGAPTNVDMGVPADMTAPKDLALSRDMSTGGAKDIGAIGDAASTTKDAEIPDAATGDDAGPPLPAGGCGCHIVARAGQFNIVTIAALALLFLCISRRRARR